VQDRGSGIPAESQPHIFDRFYRGDEARTHASRPAGGAGLGLALARWIARVHGGDVVLTRSSREGTVFTATLPDPS
jgi:signal transduction histidine kinase